MPAKKHHDRPCGGCGNLIRDPGRDAKYCSLECAKVRFKDRRGPNHQSWKGGRYVDANGYIQVHLQPDHRFASMTRNGIYVLEHRLVMAEKLGRPLRSTETVHHLNGDKADNRPENLQLRQGKHGSGVRLVCSCCGSDDLREEPI